MNARIAGLLVVGLLAVPSTSRADLVTVTSGVLIYNEDFVGPFGYLLLPQFSDQRFGMTIDPLPGTLGPVIPLGETLTFNTRATWTPAFNAWVGSGQLQFASGQVTVPNAFPPDYRWTTLETPFSMVGSLDVATRTGATVVRGDLNGSGTLRLILVQANGDARGFHVIDAGYTFGPAALPSPTPEPTSLVLLGTGIAAVFSAGMRSRRRLRSR